MCRPGETSRKTNKLPLLLSLSLSLSSESFEKKQGTSGNAQMTRTIQGHSRTVAVVAQYLGFCHPDVRGACRLRSQSPRPDLIHE